MRTIKNDLGYQFIPVPMNLYLCMDNNCRSMFATMVQLSSYYANEDGWFFRTNDDLRAQSRLSENVVRATISSLYSQGLLDVKCVGKSNGTIPNYFRLNTERFSEWDNYSIEDCCKNPMYSIETHDYSVKGWKASYLLKDATEGENPISTIEVFENENTSITQPTTSSTTLSKIEYNIDNTENKNNITDSKKAIEETTSNDTMPFEEYKKQEDYLMEKLFNVKNWTDFNIFRKDIAQLAQKSPSENCKERTILRFKKIRDGKFDYFKMKYENEPYRESLKEFYKEANCGWLGKTVKSDNTIEEYKPKEPRPTVENLNEEIIDVPKESKSANAPRPTMIIEPEINVEDDYEDDGLGFLYK